MEVDKRFYTRYPVSLEAIGAHEKGFNIKGELLDLSIEGAKLRLDGIYPLQEGESICLAIKGGVKLKILSKIVWLMTESGRTVIGLKFENIDPRTSQCLSTILSEIALSSLTDKYLR